MILKDLRLLALAAALYVFPACAFIVVAAMCDSAAAAAAAALAVAGSVAYPMAGRVSRIASGASPSHRRRALDAGFWMMAIGLTPVLAFLVFAFGGLSMVGAFAVALITFPLNLWQLDDALVGLAAP